MAKNKKKNKIDLGTAISEAVQTTSTASVKPTTKSTTRKNVRTVNSNDTTVQFDRNRNFGDVKDIRTVDTVNKKKEVDPKKEKAKQEYKQTQKKLNQAEQTYNATTSAYQNALSKELEKRGTNFQTKFDDYTKKKIGFQTKEEDTKIKKPKMSGDILDARKSIKKEVKDREEAYKQWQLANYENDVAKVNSEDSTFLDKTVLTPVRAINDLLSPLDSDHTVVDEKGNKTFLPTYNELKQQKVRSDTKGLGGFLQDIGYNATKILGAGLIDAGTAGVGGKALYWTDMATDNFKQAKNQGYDNSSAIANTIVSTGTEFLTEKLLGGLSKKLTGGKMSEVQKGISSKIYQLIQDPKVANVIGSMGSEGAEEFLQEWIGAVNDAITLGKDIDIWETFKNSLYSAAVGAGSGGTVTGVSNTEGAQIQNNINNMNQAIYGLNLQNPISESLQNSVDEAIQTAQNYVKNPFTADYEKAATQVNEIMQQVQNGEIDYQQANQQMQQVQDGTYQQNKNLNEIASNEVQQIQQAVENGTMNVEQANEQIQAVNNALTSEREKINQPTQTNLNERVQGQPQQQEIKPTNTEDKIQNFRNSVENEHIEDADGFYKAAEKIIKDKDYNVIMDSSITNKDGKPVNALIESGENGITIKINPKSERAGEILLMHEVTHGIETKQMRNLIMDFAKKNEGFNEALEDLKKAYGTEDVTPEVVADISGQLFGNQEFIDSLSTQNPTLFKRIHDLIVSLKNKLTGNSKYDNFVKDLAVKYEKAYRKANTQTAKKNIQEGVKYSQNAEITDDKGRKLTKEQQEFYKDVSPEMRDSDGHLTTIYHTTSDKIKPFYVFDPRGTQDYLYGDDVVIFGTNDSTMSESYAGDDGFEEVDTSKNADTSKKAKWRYEVYMNIKNPYVVDSKGRMFHNAVVEFTDKINNLFNEVEKYKGELHELAKESEKRYNESRTKGSYMDNRISKSIYKNIDDELISDTNLEELTNYKDFYEKATKEGYELPSPDTKIEDLMYDWGEVEYLREEYGDYRVDGYLEMTLEDFINKMSENSIEYKEESTWFEKNYEKIIGNVLEQAGETEAKEWYAKHVNTFTGKDWYNIAKEMFTQEAKEKNAPQKYQYNTNHIVKYILEENKTKLQNDKYDGVIFKNIIDTADVENLGKYKPANVYVAFNSNQVKAVDNKTPTENSDIRYSEKADKWQKFIEDYFKNEGTTTNLKEKINKPTKKEVTKQKTKETIDNFNAAKKGKLKQRSFPVTATEATGDQELLSKADRKALEYQVQTNESSYKRAKKNLDKLDYKQRVFRVTDKLNSDKKITLNDVVEAQIVLLEASQSNQTQDYLNILQDLSIMQTELGQMVQAASMIQKMSPDGQIAMLNKMINRQQAMNNKIYEGVELKPDKVQKVLDAYDDASHTTFNQEKLDNAMEELTQDIADQMKVTIGEKINSWRYLSMLGNFKTHIRNIVANGAMFAVNKFKNTQSAAMQDIFIKDKANKTKTLKRASKDVKDFTKLAYEQVFSDSNNVGNKYNDKKGLESKRKIYKNKVLEFLRNLNDKALTSEDQLAKKFTFKDSFSNYLVAQGINTTEDINAHPEIIQAAKAFALDEANVATFNQENKLAQWLNDADRKLGTPGQVVRGAIIPFTRTPLNIAKTGIQYTPGVGWFFGAAEMKNAPKNMRGNIFINNLSKQITGTSLALVGFALSQAGVLTGDSGDDKEDKFEKDQGAKMDYSIKIDGVNYDLSWLSPSSMPLFVGARMNEILVKKEGIDPNFVIEGLISTLDPLSELSCLSGFTKVLKSYKQDSAGMIGDMGGSTARNYVSQFLPTLLGQFSQAIDTKKRSTYPDKNSTFTFGQKTLRELQYKTPARMLLPEQTDYFGEAKKEEENTLARVLKAFFSPANTKKDTMSKESKELIRLYKETGNDDVLPTGLQAYLNYNGNKYDMSQKEYNQYKKDYGDAFKDTLHELMNSTRYNNSSDDEKADMIAGIMKYSKDKAKDNYLTDKGEDYIKVNEKGTTSYYESDKVDNLTNSDFTIADYYIYSVKAPKVVSGQFQSVKNKISMVQTFDLDPQTYEEYLEGIGDIEADYTSSGKLIRNSKKKKVAAFLNDLDLEPYQRAALFKQNYKSYRSSDRETMNYIINSDLSEEEKESLASFLKFK